jgi:glycosyl transferase family 11
MIVTFSALGRYGRWANQLYQIASTTGIARRNNADYAFPEWQNFDHHRLGYSGDIDVEKYFVNPLPRYDGPPLPDHFVHWGYRDVVLTESVSLSGHMQSEKFFEHAIDEVRWQLRMVDEYPRSNYCGIHVRRGDYDGDYHPRIPASYYYEAMKHVVGPYLLFSDDIAECRHMFGSDVEYSECRDYLDDFKLLKSCSRFIIGNSSYGAIAAVLSDAPGKQVVAPRPWFGAKYTAIDGEDIYGSDWRVINWT